MTKMGYFLSLFVTASSIPGLHVQQKFDVTFFILKPVTLIKQIYAQNNVYVAKLARVFSASLEVLIQCFSLNFSCLATRGQVAH